MLKCIKQKKELLMNIYEYLDTIPELDSTILSRNIIKKYKNYLNCENITKPIEHYSELAFLDPGKAIEELIYDISELLSIESCGNKIDEHGYFQDKLFDEINENFVPEEE
jgi:hypothetical protein